VTTSETGAAWNEFFADLVARGLSAVRLATSDAHHEPVETAAANLPGASWQRCRMHLRRQTHVDHAEGDVARGQGDAAHVYDQPDRPAAHAQFHRLLDYVDDKVQHPRRAPQPRDPTPHRRRGHLP
jgi:putative transposase